MIRLASEHGTLLLTVTWTTDSPAVLCLRTCTDTADTADTAGAETAPPAQPLVEILAVGHGREWAGRRLVNSGIGGRLRYRSHEVDDRGAWRTARVHQVDPETGLHVISEFALHDSGLRSVTRVRNEGPATVRLQAVSSLVFADFQVDGPETIDRMTLTRGTNDWLAEGRWSTTDLRSAGLPGLAPHGGIFRSRGCIEAASAGSWSTAEQCPTAVLDAPPAGRRWSFQIEHNGPWVWQVGEQPDGLYAAFFGPTDEQHQWQLALRPGEEFVSVPASVTVESSEGLSALAALTRFRRASRARTAAMADRDPGALPIVFNDYMNTVNGDPTAQVLHPLIDAAADSGADIFVIDAGWYAEDGEWWDSVGEWQPSSTRFPDGIGAVLEHIRGRGLRAGLWLEPEVVGVRSPMAVKLPDSAFLSRDGVRVVEHGRYHLDYCSTATTGFMDEVVDRLVTDLGVGYFKFDYNIRAGAGSDAVESNVGHGLLRHNRAFLDWIDGVRARHPSLLLETCASGGMRADFATISHFDLQSTSDQEDLHAYAPIAASAPMLMAPEQAANWAYPQPEMSDDELAFTLCTAMLGRLYLSGWLSRLSPAQLRVVSTAVQAHRYLLERLDRTVPVWPLGLPGWSDEWIALCLADEGDEVEDAPATVHLTVWRRSQHSGLVAVPLPPPPQGHRWGAPAVVFPDTSPLVVSLNHQADVLTVSDPDGRHAARVVSLTAIAE